MTNYTLTPIEIYNLHVRYREELSAVKTYEGLLTMKFNGTIGQKRLNDYKRKLGLKRWYMYISNGEHKTRYGLLPNGEAKITLYENMNRMKAILEHHNYLE